MRVKANVDRQKAVLSCNRGVVAAQHQAAAFHDFKPDKRRAGGQGVDWDLLSLELGDAAHISRVFLVSFWLKNGPAQPFF
jgi:hypothetical protein